MDWNSLKILTLVDKTGSMTAASKALGVNYTTVFRRLESLEKEVGGKLFVRGSQKYLPTPLAEEVLKLAHSMFERSEDIERYIAGREFLPSGVVKITAPFNIANRYLPNALADIVKEYPEIKFEILSSNDAFNLNSRVADIAVRATKSPPDHLVGRKASSIPWALFASERFLCKYSEPPTLDTLADFPLIGANGNMLDLPAFSWLESAYKESIAARCDELTAMSHCAEAGIGIAFLPLDQARSELIKLDIFPPGKTSDLWILYHPDLRTSERIRIVAEHLYNHFQTIDFRY